MDNTVFKWILIFSAIFLAVLIVTGLNSKQHNDAVYLCQKGVKEACHYLYKE